ncbi:MAG: Asp-tRNA(Asn)/Glu-tRNA(Gln) amidotransferase subunit GatA [Armatimonadota bacterium]|nr:MAG: Asp-tRNA(Asn)/Glu-tRNA(Gln) amidotransferase subunit GatA [Armatimonadota bacterium]
MSALNDLTAHELSELLGKREASAREVLEATCARIDEVEDNLAAYLLLTREEAERQASAVDERRARGEDLPALAGVPLALKDIFCTKGIETTCGSRILKGFVPPYDADVVERCRENGLVLVGKTNMDEFAMGSSTENSAFGVTHNPWDLERVPGGSSGGSAAAAAASSTIVALGTDTGGSIRQPASFCGVVGLKPTYGRISRYGVVAFASSLDQVGAITKDVRDCALMLNVLAGHDPRDSTSIAAPAPDYTRALVSELAGMRVGLVKEFMEYQGVGVDREVGAAVRGAVERFHELGAECGEVSLPHLNYSIPVYYLIAPAEASSNLARYDGVQYGYRTPEEGAADIIEMYRKTRDDGFGPEVKRRIMLGTYALSAGYYDAYYLKASQVRGLIRRDFDRAFEQYDILVGPTSPTVAFRLGEKTEDPIAMYLSDVCTIPVNMGGLPGMSLPCGFSPDGMPIGLQLVGRSLGEEALLRAAYAFEQTTDFHRRRAHSVRERNGRRCVVARASA